MTGHLKWKVPLRGLERDAIIVALLLVRIGARRVVLSSLRSRASVRWHIARPGAKGGKRGNVAHAATREAAANPPKWEEVVAQIVVRRVFRKWLELLISQDISYVTGGV